MASHSARRNGLEDGGEGAAATSGQSSRSKPPLRGRKKAANSPRLTPLHRQPSNAEVEVTPFSPTHLSPTEEHYHRPSDKFELRPSSSSQSLHAAFNQLSLTQPLPSHQHIPLSQSSNHLRSSLNGNIEDEGKSQPVPANSISSSSTSSKSSSSTSSTRNKLPLIQTTFENGKPTATYRALETPIKTPANGSAAFRAVRGPFMTPKTSVSVQNDSPYASTTMTTPSSTGVGLRQPFHFSPARQNSQEPFQSPATSVAESTTLRHDSMSLGRDGRLWDDAQKSPSYQANPYFPADGPKMLASLDTSTPAMLADRSMLGDLDRQSSSSGVLDATISRQEDEARHSASHLPPTVSIGSEERRTESNGSERRSQGDDNAFRASGRGSDASATSSLSTVTSPERAQHYLAKEERESTSKRNAESSQGAALPSLNMLSASPERSHTLHDSPLSKSPRSVQPMGTSSGRTASLVIPNINAAPAPPVKPNRSSRPMLARLNTSEAVKMTSADARPDPTRKQSLSASRLTVNTSFGGPRSATMSEGVMPDLTLGHTSLMLNGATIFATPESMTNDDPAEPRLDRLQAGINRSRAATASSFEPSVILDGFLYLGPDIATSCELEYLKDAWGVKRILNAAYEVEDLLNISSAGSGIERYKRIPMRDTVEATGVQEDIEKACAFIDDARLHSAPVYVHCKAGKSRSVLLVMAYLIHANHWSLPQAYSFVVERRRTVSPNIGFVAELMTFEQRRLHRGPTMSRLDFSGSGSRPSLRGTSKWSNRDSLPTSSSVQPITLSFWDHLAITQQTQQKKEGSEVQRLVKASAGPKQEGRSTTGLISVHSLKEYRRSDGRYHPARPPADEKSLISPWRASMAAIDSDHFFPRQ